MRYFRIALSAALFASLSCLCALTRAADKPAPPAATPAGPPTAPAAPAAPAVNASDDAEIRKLIIQLGDGDYKKREEASKKLKTFGKAALPILKDALATDDVEVTSRVQALIKRLEARPLPGGPFDPNAAIRPTRLHMSAADGNRILEVSDDSRDLRIVQGPDGILMTVTGDSDGERITEEYTAKDPEQLKKENPEAYALYQRWTGPGNGPGFILRGPMQIGGVQGGIVVGPGAVAGPVGAPDELDLLRLNLEKQFRQNKTKDEDREKVVAELEKLANARASGDMEGYTAKCDELRKMLEDQKLTAGDFLPPPAKLRLGVSIGQDIGGVGLVVQRIGDKSRGERLGLQVGDTIRKVDGKDVKSVAELRKAVSAKDAGLIVEVAREGKEMKLEEKGEEKK